MSLPISSILYIVAVILILLSFLISFLRYVRYKAQLNQNNNGISPANGHDNRHQQSLDIYLIHDERGNVHGIVSPSNGGPLINSELPRPTDWPPPYSEDLSGVPPPPYEDSNNTNSTNSAENRR